MSGHDRNPPVDLNTAVRTFLNSAGLRERSLGGLCAFLWQRVAGEWYATHCHVTSVRGGIVNVRCDSAPRAQQLQLDAPEIIERLNEEIGEEFVAEIRPSSGGIDRGGETRIAEPKPEPTPTREELDEIEVPADRLNVIHECAARADADFREQIEQIMIAHEKADIWRREHGFVQCPECGTYHLDSDDYCLACRPPDQPTNAGGEEGLSAFFD